MKRWLFPLLLCLLISPAKGQGKGKESSFADGIFHSYGLSSYLDIIYGPLTTYEDAFGDTQFIQPYGTSYFTGAYRGRYNLAEISDNIALSTSLTPALGFAFFEQGLLHLNLPAQVNAEIGALSTRNTDADFGVVAGAGYELNIAPIIVNNVSLPAGERLKTVWLQKSFSLGFRFRRGSHIMEVNLKYGEGPGTFHGQSMQRVKARTIRLMAFYFF